MWLTAIVWLLAGVSAAHAQKFDASRLARIDRVVNDAIGQSKLSGAVVVVGAGNRVVYRKAFGLRAVEPGREAMTLDTVFDAASLTKVVATTPSVMALVEEGRLRLNDRVSTYVPGFERYGKRDITIRHLLTHTSGLRPDVDLTFDWMGAPRAIELAVEEVPLARPDERFIYSDINFFLLGHIVATVSGMSLDQFARARIFEPLEMRDTTFLPPEAWRERIAPTEKCTPYGFPCSGPGVSASGLQMLRGVVHDPTARRMGGVAGHAGLFTTADDLATYCRMLLRGGAASSGRVLAPLTVARMISASMPVGERNVRGLGWDIDSSFSSNRGELLPLGSFGHTGFTGTSIWIDPELDLFVVLLTNRVNPTRENQRHIPLRRAVHDAVARAVRDRPVPPRR